MSAVHFSFTPLLNERCRDLFQSDCFLFSKSDVGVMEPYNDDRWNHDLFESHKPVKATHCFQTKAEWSAWEQDETNYAGVEATPLPSPAHLLQPNPHRWCLTKKAFSCLRLSTPSNIEVAKNVINVRQSGQDAPSSLDFTVRGTTRNVSRDFVVSSKKKQKKTKQTKKSNPRKRVCVYVSAHTRVRISRGGVRCVRTQLWLVHVRCKMSIVMDEASARVPSERLAVYKTSMLPSSLVMHPEQWWLGCKGTVPAVTGKWESRQERASFPSYFILLAIAKWMVGWLLQLSKPLKFQESIIYVVMARDGICASVVFFSPQLFSKTANYPYSAAQTEGRRGSTRPHKWVGWRFSWRCMHFGSSLISWAQRW